MSFVQCLALQQKPSPVVQRFITTARAPIMTELSEESNGSTSAQIQNPTRPQQMMSSSNSATPNNAAEATKENNISSLGSCKECLYTGVATCSGLSLYFMKLASELPPPSSATVTAIGKEASKQVARNRQFFIGGSAVWAVAGAYRAYLG